MLNSTKKATLGQLFEAFTRQEELSVGEEWLCEDGCKACQGNKTVCEKMEFEYNNTFKTIWINVKSFQMLRCNEISE